MNKLIISITAVVCVACLSGCIVSKTEHEKALNEKASIEQKYTQLSRENAQLKERAASLEKAQERLDMLEHENMRFKEENSRLMAEKDELGRRLRDAELTVDKLSAELNSLKNALPQQ